MTHKCYSWGNHKAQKGELGKYCTLCFEQVVGLLDAEALRKEYDARVEKTRADCSPTGNEPALQLLILPAIGIWGSSQSGSCSVELVALLPPNMFVFPPGCCLRAFYFGPSHFGNV